MTSVDLQPIKRENAMTTNRKAFIVGAGIGSLAAAVFMLRDGGMRGEAVTIFDAGEMPGGSLDAGGDPEHGYVLRGSRMMTSENFECTWELLGSIPSLRDPGLSVREETLRFSTAVPWNARARLVDHNRAIVDASTMGFSMQDRLELLRISEADDADLAGTRITDWLSPGFFETNFWHLWQTTFAFQAWHGALEFKRYLHRFIRSFPRIDRLSGVKHPELNHHDSFVAPIVAWLRERGVRLRMGTTVTALDLTDTADSFAIRALEYRRDGRRERIAVAPEDLVIVQNGSMTDASSLGSMTAPPPVRAAREAQSWALCESLAAARPGLGDPAVFNAHVAETCWFSFTLTLRQRGFFDFMQGFTGNEAGTGGLVTLKDSRWLISLVLYRQPHIAGQPPGVQVAWGYALHPERVGDFVGKPMTECGGAEVLRELAGHLGLDAAVFADATCIPCRMPFITSQFMPRGPGDRPPPVPPGSRNLGFVGQFVEIPEDVVFTIEYSVRAAQIAVYRLLGIDRPIPPVTPHDASLGARLAAVIKAFA
jgi:oleate hydratase